MSAPTKPARSETALARAAADLDATIAAHKAADAAPNIPEENTIPVGNNLAATPAPAAMMEMPLAWIWPSTFNPRRTFDDTALRELADSILAHGMLEPIVVRERDVSPITLLHVTNADGETQPVYEVIAGERRYRAARLAKLDTVPVRILTCIDDTKALQLAILENLQRVDLDPIDEARGFAALRDQAGMTQAEIGAAVKRSQPVIARSLGLLKLPDDVLQMIQEGKLSASHGQLLTRLPAAFPQVISAVAAAAMQRGFTTRQLEEEPLIGANNMEQAGLVKRLYGATFDTTVCKACPFGAHVGYSGSYSAYCLNPSHFNELQAAHDKEASREINRAIQAAKREGGNVPKLRDMPYTSYKTLESPPPGCTEACACRAQAIGHNGKLQPICMKPGHFQALASATTRTVRKSQRQENAEVITALATHLQATESITVEMLAALLWPALERITAAAWKAAAERHGVADLVGEKPAKYSSNNTTMQQLVDLTQLDMIRFALDAVITFELEAAVEADWNKPITWNFYKQHMPAVTA